MTKNNQSNSIDSNKNNELTTLSGSQKILLDVVDTFGFILENGYSSLGYGRSKSDLRSIKEAKRKKYAFISRKRLEKRKLLIRKQTGKDVFYKLTYEGYLEALKLKIITCMNELPEGEICLVIFDIPEDMRHVRGAFRQLLKKAKFRMRQQSVWEGDYEVVDLLRVLIHEVGAEKYILVYRALDVR